MDVQRHREYLVRVEATVIRTRKTVERSRRAISQAEEAAAITKALIAGQSVWDLAIRSECFRKRKKVAKGNPEIL
jgi:hypothetical protein